VNQYKDKKLLGRAFIICILAGAALVAGCTTPLFKSGWPGSANSQKPAEPGTAQLALNEGVDLYDRGDYNGTVKRLATANEIWTGNKAIQVQALKYMAFSYCLTGRQALCRQQFEKALRINPAFDLAPGEKGHPLWSPVFEQAKKAR